MRAAPAVSGGSGRRRRGAWGGGARGVRDRPRGGFDAARGGLWRRLRVLRRPAAGLCRGGDAPVGKEGWVRVEEHQRESEEVVVCSVWEKGDRRRELHGELLGGGGHGGGGGASGAGRSRVTALSGERGEGRVLRLALRLGEVYLGLGMMGRGDGKGTTASGTQRRRVGQGGVEGAWHGEESSSARAKER